MYEAAYQNCGFGSQSISKGTYSPTADAGPRPCCRTWFLTYQQSDRRVGMGWGGLGGTTSLAGIWLIPGTQKHRAELAQPLPGTGFEHGYRRGLQRRDAPGGVEL